MPKHFLRIFDFPRDVARQVLLRAYAMKQGDMCSHSLAGRTVTLLFEKASTRTRISFEVAVTHLGGRTVFVTPMESQLGRNEPLRDTARVLSRYTDCLVVRTFEQDRIVELAKYARVPVVNALTDLHHPCQVMSDMLTIYERTPKLEELTVAWVGDGNNMCHCFLAAAAWFGFTLRVATPVEHAPEPAIVEEAKAKGARLIFTSDPLEAVAGAAYINTDCWVSMGQEDEHDVRIATFVPYQVNAALLAKAAMGAKIMHCLPAYRGQEITDEVMEGPASIIWDQAENRLHMQKAILEYLFTI
ncbi:Ornithine carbamoyltransferase [Desulfovibrionales bacterium]